MRRVFHLGCLSLILMFAGAAAAGFVFARFQRSERSDQIEKSLNGESPYMPKWLRLERPCQAPSQEQVRRDEVMAEVADRFPAPAKRADPGMYYAIHYFGWHWAINEPGRCPPAQQLYERLGRKLDQGAWPPLPDDRNDLRLIEHLPPSAGLARRIARIAFNSYPLTNEPLHYDNRPYARMLLGEQGPFAALWKDRAMREIAPDTKLGTSAAYLAVAVAPGEALPRVQRAILEMTKTALARQEKRTERNVTETAISIRDGYRLYELAYAMSMAGEKAQPFSAPIIRLLDHNFAAGSHFGLLFLPPTGLCDVARHIGGPALAAANRKDFCVKHFRKEVKRAG